MFKLYKFLLFPDWLFEYKNRVKVLLASARSAGLTNLHLSHEGSFLYGDGLSPATKQHSWEFI